MNSAGDMYKSHPPHEFSAGDRVTELRVAQLAIKDQEVKCLLPSHRTDEQIGPQAVHVAHDQYASSQCIKQLLTFLHLSLRGSAVRTLFFQFGINATCISTALINSFGLRQRTVGDKRQINDEMSL